MKHEDKKHFDVSKPRRKSPDPTSKPIIVGHHPMMPDPMIREEREKAPKPIKVVSDGDESEPLTVRNSKDETLEVKPEAQPDPPVEEPVAAPEIPPESAPGAIFHPPDKSTEPDAAPAELPGDEVKTETPEASAADPIVPAAVAGAAAASAPEIAAEAAPGKEQPQPAAAEPPAGQELHIPAGHGHAQVRHKPRIWVWVTIGIIILIWVYAAVDALTNTKLPLEFFENSNQTAQPVTNAPTQTPPAQTNPTQNTQEPENKSIDFNSSGDIITENQQETIQKLTFIAPKGWQRVWESENEWVVYRSPDFKGAQLANGSTVDEGGEFSISAYTTEYKSISDMEKDDAITYFSVTGHTTLDGVEAVKGSCGHNFKAACFGVVYKGYYYQLSYRQVDDGSQSNTPENKYSKEFDSLVKSANFSQ